MVYNDKVDKAVKPVRIAISGKMRSGKDSAARRLVERHGFQRYAFADRLKELASELFGTKPGQKNRTLLVQLGRRLVEIDKLVWVRYVFNKIPLGADVVIPDLRFGYELQELKRLGFRLVRIDIARDRQVQRVLQTEPDTDLALLDDVSETALDAWRGWDQRIDGGQAIDQFNVAVDRMAERFRREA